MFVRTIHYTTRRSAQRALDAQPVNGFVVEVGSAGHYYVTHPAPRLWLLMDRRRAANDPAAVGTARQVLDAVFGGQRWSN